MQKDGLQREQIIKYFKEQGYRITKQRLVILDVILKDRCSSCKEIYHKAFEIDSTIGPATVYRMIGTLKQIGVLNRENKYQISFATKASDVIAVIELDDQTSLHLSKSQWDQVVFDGLKKSGYLTNQKIQSIVLE